MRRSGRSEGCLHNAGSLINCGIYFLRNVCPPVSAFGPGDKIMPSHFIAYISDFHSVALPTSLHTFLQLLAHMEPCTSAFDLTSHGF